MSAEGKGLEVIISSLAESINSATNNDSFIENILANIESNNFEEYLCHSPAIMILYIYNSHLNVLTLISNQIDFQT